MVTMKREVCRGCPSQAICITKADFADPLNVFFCTHCGVTLVSDPPLKELRQQPTWRRQSTIIRAMSMNCARVLKPLTVRKVHLEGACPVCAACVMHTIDQRQGLYKYKFKQQFAVMIAVEGR